MHSSQLSWTCSTCSSALLLCIIIPKLDSAFVCNMAEFKHHHFRGGPHRSLGSVNKLLPLLPPKQIMLFNTDSQLLLQHRLGKDISELERSTCNPGLILTHSVPHSGSTDLHMQSDRVRGDQVVLLKQILLPRERTHYSCSVTHGIPFYKRTSGKIRLHGQNLKEEKGVK